MLVVVQNHVFQYGAETQRLENIGFALRCEVDGFRVAAAFDIEDAILAPAMLVVSDEMTLRIGRKGGLASAAEAEKQRRTAGFLVRRRGPPTALMNSVHEGDKKVCRKKDQMDRPLHQVSATCAKSDGAHQERYHEHSDVLRLQPQY